MLSILGAAVSAFQRAGIPVLVYLRPLNVEHMRAIGVLDEAALARSIGQLEAVVRQNAGEFADFHDLLPDDEAFTDSGGHYNPTGEPHAHRIIADAVAPLVASRAQRANAAPSD